jgi:hypothetical protein
LRGFFTFGDREHDDALEVVRFLFDDFECAEKNRELVAFEFQCFTEGRGEFFRRFACRREFFTGLQSVLNGRD